MLITRIAVEVGAAFEDILALVGLVAAFAKDSLVVALVKDSLVSLVAFVKGSLA